ncbi:SIMPL domain-containing protein [Bacillus sp. EB01]|uniref:SIMPL domain-containing protein n=1 Tax=Bacillus sp. EB01 TaxID=1347086 RepID=UPI0005C43D51|nr:SIMPL domain-containing protein [Bacillus sp. EB01]
MAETFERQSNLKKDIIQVQGEGSVAASPDTATVTVGVSTEVQDLVQGQQQNARAVAAVIQSIQQTGIPAENIKTLDYRIESVYDYKDGVQTFRGYKITHLLQVTISDLEKVGTVVDTAVQNGANYISDIAFTAKRKEGLYNEALELAVRNSFNKAKTIAGAINVALDSVPVQVTEENRIARPLMEYQVPMVKGATSTPIQPGQLLIEATVTAIYTFKRKA